MMNEQATRQGRNGGGVREGGELAEEGRRPVKVGVGFWGGGAVSTPLTV